MTPVTLLRLALAGTRTDTVRVLLTATASVLATLAMLATATVMAIRPRAADATQDASGDELTRAAPGAELVPAQDGYAYQYTHNLLVEPGLRPGVAIALLLLCIPVLALAGQSAQLGAPARHRRLAQIRLAGATPRQAVAVAVAETGLAALLGTLVGTGVYLAGRTLLHQPRPDGRLPLPTDVLPPSGSMVLIGAGLPLLAAGFAALLLRRVAFTPFGLARQQRTRRPRPWPAVAIALGVGAFVAIMPIARAFQSSDQSMPQWIVPVLLGGGSLATMLGVVFGVGYLSHLTGRVLHRLARRPATLVAARRLMADPWSGSRAFAALLAATLVGAGAAGVRAWFAADFGASEDSARASAAAQGIEHAPGEYDFYFGSLDLVDAAVTVGIVIAGLGLLVYLAEGLVSRRRTYAALTAAGVPRRTMAATIGWQMLTPAVPAIMLALAAGVALPRAITREVRSGGHQMTICTVEWERCEESGSPYLETVHIPEFVRPVEIPVTELAQVGGVAMAAVIATVGVGLLFLRATTEVAELRAV